MRLRETVLLTLLLLAACASATAPCAPDTPIPLPIHMIDKAALVPVSFPRGPAVLLLDTGSDITNLTREAAHRLGIKIDPLRKLPGQTVGGVVQDNIGLATDLHVGPVVIPAMAVAITETSPAEGVLGLDFLQRFDVDFDLGHGRVTLHTGGLCRGQRPPWRGEFQEFAISRSVTGRALDGSSATKPYLMLPATLDGHATLAMLDTGALLGGLVNPAFAAEIGLTPGRLARDPEAIAGGFGPSAPLRMHRFTALDLGAERIGGLVLAVGGEADKFPLVLGMDLFLSHRIWLSFSTDRVFLQPKLP